jgi:uracil-DNA glycosylase family 4
MTSDAAPITDADHPGNPHADPAGTAAAASDLAALDTAITSCFACPRLVAWRELTAERKVKRFRNETYWGRPVPGFGDPEARIFLVGLAPAANGGNRTGRVFTGDASGDFLFAALFAVGLANQPSSTDRDDGLVLRGVRIASAGRCAPPANVLLPDEQDRCRPFLIRELELLPETRVLVGLGKVGWDACLRVLGTAGHPIPRPLPRFGHGAEVRIGPYWLLGTYHPSQQNTNTGVLTQPMIQSVLRRAIELAT